MKSSAILLGIFIMLSTLILVGQNIQPSHITGKSASDTGTVRTTIISSTPPAGGGSGGGGAGGGGQSSTVSPAVYGRATSGEKSRPQEVENYYESQDLKFAPITTSVATLKSPAERGRLSTATKTFLFGLALIVLAILIALILSHSHGKKKHRFKRNKV